MLVVLALLAAIPAACVSYRMTDSTAPKVTIRTEAKAIGRSPTKFVIEADEPRYGVTDLRAAFSQGAVVVPLAEATNPGRPWWRVWGQKPPASSRLEVEIGPERIPEMAEGEATIHAESTNDSWARFGRGRTARAETSVPVLLKPPRVESLSGQLYVSQGGAEAVRYRVSETAVRSGVKVGDHWFQGYPAPGGGPGERVAIFAFPQDMPATTTPSLFATDAAGNEAGVPLTCRVTAKGFRSATMDIEDAFLQRVVPAILSQTPSVRSQNDLVKDFVTINGSLRHENARSLVEMSARSRPEKLWSGAFTQLGGSKVEAGFADRRTYRYRGEVIDRQDHLGFDLAVTANHVVDAAAAGVVEMAGWLGIYGNTVVVDHGLGVMTLYAHLSSIDVKTGDSVAKGQPLGRSGATGLAGGDHLHFSVLVQGVSVNPIEWWDPRWVRDRIEAKLEDSSARAD